MSFGLVSIPVRLYVATHSEQPSFNMIHEVCRSRIKQQTWCPRCERVVERSELVKGREVAKDQYVLFTDEELKALEAAASQSLDIQEFVPLADVDPVYFQDTHYLGPDSGGEKAYQLLAEAMRDTGMVALAQHVARGKERLVLIRPFADGLSLHTLYYADEVRAFEDIDRGPKAAVKPAETTLARKLIEQLAADRFAPQQYHDHWRERLQEAVDRKVAGEEIVAAPPEEAREQIIDLVAALKKSLAEKAGAREEKAAAQTARKSAKAKGKKAASS